MNTISEVLEQRNEKGILAFEGNGWSAISRDGTHMITFEEGKFICSKNEIEFKFYQYEESWAKRVIGLIKRGY